MTFRLAREVDLDAVLDLQAQFYLHENYPYVRGVAANAARELIANAALGRLLVIENDDFVAGYMAITFGFSLEFGGRDAFIDELFVAGAHRGRGLGSRSLEVAEVVCREAGIRALHLEVEFANEAAKRLYARAGYSEHTRQLMTKRLMDF